MKIEQIKKAVADNQTIQLIKATFELWQSANSSQLAAALAYHTIFSLAPLLIIATYIAGLILGRSDVRYFVINQLQTLLGTEAADLIYSMTQNLQVGNSGLFASIIGLVTVLFGASRVFNQLETTLNIIIEPGDQRNNGIGAVLRKRGISFLMMAGVGLMLLLSVLFSTGLSLTKNLLADAIPQSVFLIRILNYLVPVLMATILFTLIFKFLPEKDLGWRHTFIGGLLTAVLFSIGQLLISFYLGNSSIASAYGAAGSLLVILVWIYYSAQIFYFGATFTKIYSSQKSPPSD